jgi:amino acid transporter
MQTAANGPSSDEHDEDRSRLRRVVTLPWLVLYGLGSTVGAGIYVLTGVVAGRAGGLAPLAFVLAGGLAALTALSFAALSARLPHAGGALVYVREGLGSRPLSVAVGLGSAAAGTVSAATVTLGFTAYFGDWVPHSGAIVLPCVALGVGGLAAWGIRESVVAAGVVTLVEIGGLLAVLGLGGWQLATGPAIDPGSLVPAGGWTSSVWMVVSSTVVCFFAYLGFEDMVNVAEEVRDVRRVMPRAIGLTLAISTALYVAVSFVSVLVVPPLELAGSDAPLTLVFERAGGPASLLTAIALVAMLNGALVQMLMASRILYSLGRTGPLPGWLGRVHPRTQTPLAATLCVTIAVMGLAAWLPLERLAAATASIALAVFALVNASLVRIRLRERASGPADAGGRGIGVPLLGAVASVTFLLIELGHGLFTPG